LTISGVENIDFMRFHFQTLHDHDERWAGTNEYATRNSQLFGIAVSAGKDFFISQKLLIGGLQASCHSGTI